MLVHEILEITASRLPDKMVLLEEGNKLTYDEMMAKVWALSARLEERGVSSGDRVALLFPNSIGFCLSYFAVLKLGAVVVPLNNRLSSKELVYIVNDSGARTLIVEDQFWEVYQAIKHDLLSLENVIYAGNTPYQGIEFLADLIAPGPKPSVKPNLSYDSAACIMYTSGTTGLPKGAIMSHGNIFYNARNCGAHLNFLESDVSLIAVPLFHVTGLNSQLIAFLYVGGTCVIMRSYKTASMLELIERFKVTALFNVPTMYTLMLASDSFNQHDLSSLRKAAYGGAPMDPETIVELKTRLGIDLYNAYGLTETSSLTTVLPSCDAVRKAGSVGLPVSNVTLRIIDNNGNPLPYDRVGELLIAGPNVVSGYWNNPEATAQNIIEGWLYTGDLAKIDPEGFVYIVDRKKDMINRGGENIYSIEVESALVAHPKILEAAVVPRKHSIFGEVVHAFVVLTPNTDATEEEIIDYCKTLIAEYKVPASISFTDELPRNPGGKVLKTVLREKVPLGDPPRR